MYCYITVLLPLYYYYYFYRFSSLTLVHFMQKKEETVIGQFSLDKKRAREENSKRPADTDRF